MRNKVRAERKGGERFRAVKFLIADEQSDDLHGDGGDGFEGIGGEVGGEACGHDDDHGFADGARNGEQEAAGDALAERRAARRG